MYDQTAFPSLISWMDALVKVLSAVTGTREMDAVPVTFRIMDADREAVPVLIGVLPEVRLPGMETPVFRSSTVTVLWAAASVAVTE